jgi:hypothetical protein
MAVPPMLSPTKTSPPKAGVKRKIATPVNSPGPKRRRQVSAVIQKMKRPKTPIAEPWPVHALRAFDAPLDINYGPILKEMLRERGWKYSKNPCHATYDKETFKCTIYTREFEASLLGKKPVEVYGKKGSVQDGYNLQEIKLPNHAMWFMGWMPYRVPGTCNERSLFREDFCKILCEHGDKLPGKPGNYRMGKFPGTETLMFKTNLTEAFNDKPWYPPTFTLPRDKASFLKELRSRGESKSNMWIGKPRNDYGGSGLRVWKGTDPDLARVVRESDNHPKSIVQHYLADPHLVGGYKYHMRIHLVITNISPLEAFVQENGQCLFATKPYTLASKTLGETFDPPVHVTNMGLNSKPENKENFFRKKPIIGKGQQIRMKQLVAHLADTDPSFDKQALWQQILSIAADAASYIAAGTKRFGKIVPDRHWEIFGMDLMLDKDMKVWMCEVNTDPGLGYPDEEVLGEPNPDYQKELQACRETFHDMFALLGVDAGVPQTKGSLNHWFKLDFEDADGQTRDKSRSRSAEH